MEAQKKGRKRKRPDGDGSIRYSEAKKLWIGRLMVGIRLDGKPDIREVSAKAQKDCRERLDAVKTQVANGTLASKEVAGLTVAAFLDRWLSSVTNNRRAATHVRYHGYVENHFKPALGAKRLGKLDHDDIQTFLDARRDAKGKRGRPLAARTLHNVYVALGTALSWGVKKGYIMVSPMARVDPPRFVRTEIHPLTAEQTMHLLDVAEAEADPLRALWTVAAYTGMRKGELLGLLWSDIDLEHGTVEIRRSLRKVRKGVPSYEEPKTARSRRTLDLAPDALAALRAHHDRQAFVIANLKEAYSDGDVVFASERGTPLDTDNVTKRFKRVVARAELPAATRFHDLRHGTATLMLEAGESVPTVAEYLGHATPAVTMTVYAHAVPGSKKRAAERLGAIFQNARKSAETAAEGASAAG